MATKQKEQQVPDLDAIVPADGVVEVEGHKYRVRRLRLIELAALFRVITSGLGPAIAQSGVRFDLDDSEEMLGLVLLAIPNAIDEFRQFLSLVCEPVDGDMGLVANPDPDAVLTILSVMLEQEKDDWRALLGKAQKVWSLQIQPLLTKGRTGSQG
jgi:hypothetical protein